MNKLIIDHKQLTFLVAKIARSIYLSNWKPDYIVGLTRGGLVPGVMLSHYLGVPLNTLNVSLRDGQEQESNLWMAEDAFGYVTNSGPDETKIDPAYRKNILIVDDINEPGSTFNWITKDWPSGCLPDHDFWNHVWNKNVKFAVLVDNLASKCEYAMDFVGMEINKAENDVWVDFPWEDWWTK